MAPTATPVAREVVQAIPEPAPEPASEPAATPAPRAASQAATPAPVAVASEDRPSVPSSEAELATAEPIVPPVIEPVAVPTVAAAPSPATDNTMGLLAAFIGTLAILALAIWGFVAMGRRKAPFERAAVPTIERPVVAPRDRDPVPPVAPAGYTPAQPPHLVVSDGTHGGLPHAGASVALPRTLPRSFAERAALLKRMVAAKPDRANPFTDGRARTKRARLILQSLGRDFGDSKPWIDLSQYPNNWPELARHKSVAA